MERIQWFYEWIFINSSLTSYENIFFLPLHNERNVPEPLSYLNAPLNIPAVRKSNLQTDHKYLRFKIQRIEMYM